MKLISCYIENFGRISKYSYEFTDGLNIIEEENGWGKTTFAAFVKAMLFGLEYTTARKNLVDRNRYMPWQGGKFGGNLIFEVNGIKYRVERSFGKKESDDTFDLYDVATNTLSTNYSSALGTEIWNVDRDSYEKSAFITLKDMELLNDIISGKLGNIDEQEADMDASGKAIEILAEEMKAIKSIRKTNGKINKVKSENQSLKDELERSEASLRMVEQYEEWLKVERENIANLNRQQLEIDQEQAKILQYQKKKQLLILEKERNVAKNEFADEKQFFQGEELSEVDVATLEEDIKKYNEWKLKSNMPKPQIKDEVEQLTKLSAKYEGVISSEKEIDEYITSYGKNSGLVEKQILLEEELAKVEEEHVHNETVGRKKNKIGALGVIGIVVLLAGTGVTFKEPLFGGGIFLVGLVLVITQIIIMKKVQKTLKKEENDYLKRKNKLEENLSDLNKESEMLQVEYQTFLQELDVEASCDTIQELLNVKADFTTYRQLKNSVNETKSKYYKQHKEVVENLEKVKQIIETKLQIYYPDSNVEYGAALDAIKNKRVLCSIKEKQLKEIEKKYEDFQVKNNIDYLQELVVPEETEEELVQQCMERKNVLSAEKIEIDKKIASYMHDINTAQIDIDKIVDIETSIENNLQRILEMEKNYELLNAAKKCMEEAKENLAEKYMEEMTVAFKKYLGLLGNKEKDLFSIDTQLNVKIEEAGALHGSELLSRGKKDLVQFCMRMALVDAVYKEVDAPTLILDDPFVNLDDVTVTHGGELLNKVGQEYQIIYFVCHNSRAFQ